MCESLHNNFTSEVYIQLRSTFKLWNKKRWNIQIYEYYLCRSTQKWVRSQWMSLFVWTCLLPRTGLLERIKWLWPEYVSRLCVIPKRTRQRAKTLKSILIFLFCAEKPIPKCPAKKLENLSRSNSLLLLIHALFKTWFLYRFIFTRTHNTTERTNPDFVYICKSNHTSHLLVHAPKEGIDVWTNVNLFEPWASSVDTTYYKRQQLPLK